MNISTQESFNPYESVSAELMDALDHITERRLGPNLMTVLTRKEAGFTPIEFCEAFENATGKFVLKQIIDNSLVALAKNDCVLLDTTGDTLQISLAEETTPTTLPLVYALQAWQLHNKAPWTHLLGRPSSPPSNPAASASFGVLSTILQCDSYVAGETVPSHKRYKYAISRLLKRNILIEAEEQEGLTRLILAAGYITPAQKLVIGIQHAERQTDTAKIQRDLRGLSLRPDLMHRLVTVLESK